MKGHLPISVVLFSLSAKKSSSIAYHLHLTGVVYDLVLVQKSHLQ